MSEAIETLRQIKAQFGEISITGGYLCDDTPPREITVTNNEGYEIWPNNSRDHPRTNPEIFISL